MTIQASLRDFLSGETDIQEVEAVINREYSRNLRNFVPYGVVNLTVLAGLWYAAMWLGLHYLRESGVDANVLLRASQYATSGNTFVFAFAFSANVNKFIQSKAQWAEILAGIRDLGGYLSCLSSGQSDDRGSVNEDLIYNVLSGNVVLAIGAKHAATRQRQKADALVPSSCGTVETPAYSELSEEYCTCLQRDTFKSYLHLLGNLRQRSDGATEQLHRLVHRILVAQQSMCANHVPTSVTAILYFLIFCTVASISAVEQSMQHAFVASVAGVGIMVLPYLVSATTVTASYSCNVGWGGIFFIGADSRLLAVIVALRHLLHGGRR